MVKFSLVDVTPDNRRRKTGFGSKKIGGEQRYWGAHNTLTARGL
jgi:hypothetical protein